MGLNTLDVRVRHCQSAEDVRAANRAVLERKRARNRPPRRIPINDATPKSFPVRVMKRDEPLKYPSIKSIIDVVCQRYKIDRMEIIAYRRASALPRQIICALARRLTPHSLPAIGQILGGRDHTTVLHACQKIDHMRATRPEFDRELLDIENELGAQPYEPPEPPPPRQPRISPWANEALACRFNELARRSLLSYPEIADVLSDEFGVVFSQIACMKRAHRLGIKRRAPVAEAA